MDLQGHGSMPVLEVAPAVSNLLEVFQEEDVSFSYDVASPMRKSDMSTLVWNFVSRGKFDYC